MSSSSVIPSLLLLSEGSPVFHLCNNAGRDRKHAQPRPTHRMKMEGRGQPQAALLRLQRNSSKAPVASWRLTTGMIEEMAGGWKPISPRPTYIVSTKRAQSRARSKGYPSSSTAHGSSLQRTVDRLYVAPRRLALGQNSGEMSGFLDSDFNYHSYHERSKPEVANVSPTSTWSGQVHLEQRGGSSDEQHVPACLQWRASLGHIGNLLPSSPCDHCSRGSGTQLKDKSMDVLDLLTLPTKKHLKKYRSSQLGRNAGKSGPINSRMSLPDLRSVPLAGWRNSDNDLRNLNAYNLAQTSSHGSAYPAPLAACRNGRREESLFPPSFTMPDLQPKRGLFGTITIVPSNPSIPSQAMKGGRCFNLEVQGTQPNKQFDVPDYMMYRRT